LRQTTAVVNTLRPSQCVDNTARWSLFAALDRREWGASGRITTTTFLYFLSPTYLCVVTCCRLRRFDIDCVRRVYQQ